LSISAKKTQDETMTSREEHSRSAMKTFPQSADISFIRTTPLKTNKRDAAKAFRQDQSN
jgi:hypothetical protein